MKNVETLLEKNSNKPTRELQRDFTQNIVNYLDEHPSKTRVSLLKEFLTMKFYAKPIIAMFAIVTVAAAGGTAYAAVGGWPGIQAFFGGQKKVTNARIVTVETKNCAITSAFNATSKDHQQDAYYYKVKDNSKLTNEQVVQMVLGNCELDKSAQKTLDVTAELDKNPLNKDSVVGNYVDSVVTAISNSSITIKSDIPVADGDQTHIQTYTQTFPNIDPDVVVYSGMQRLSLADVNVGDHVAISYRADADTLAHSESTIPGSVDGSKQVLVTIAKNSPNFSAAINFQKYNGKEFEQVVPCSTDVSGYCTAEQFNDAK